MEKNIAEWEIIDSLTEHFSLTDDGRSYLSKTGQAGKTSDEQRIDRTNQNRILPDNYFRIDIIWDELLKHLSQEEWGHVFLSIGVLPEEVILQ